MLVDIVRQKGNAHSVQVAVISTTPWDSYLIRTRIWSYPANAIVGPTLFTIPAEELFFFVIQTYITSLLYLILSKPILHPIYLRGEQSRLDGRRLPQGRWLGNVVGLGIIISGAFLVINRGKGLYMGLILLWALPFVLLLWYVA
jgi:15-cis-phytoene synthase / lycopene beta-cyclase